MTPMRTSSLTVASTLVVSLGVVCGLARPARACGGYIPPDQTVSDVTDERMILSISPTQTTLYSQLHYAGSPASFAWVLPIHGAVQVGLSADVLFDAIDALTTTTIERPTLDCAAPPAGCNLGGGSSGLDAGGGLVTVNKQQTVGPYATVQLHATDSSALSAWLTQNGFSIPATALPIIDGYVTGGFDFLAMKLLPNQGVAAMRPVRVTVPGASLMLPLRMASIGTSATVGITVWVVGDGRYEPQGFPFFHIDDSALVWDFSANASNYLALRAQNEATLKGAGWEIESSVDVAESRITSAVLSGGQIWSGAATVPADGDYLPIAPSDGGADAGPGETADQARTDDLTTLFAGLAGPNARITRIRGDIAQSAMTTDLVLQASSDQSELSNVRVVSSEVNGTCPIYNCVDAGPTNDDAGTPDASTSGPAPGGGDASAATPLDATTGSDNSDGPIGAQGGAVAASGGGGCAAASESDAGSSSVVALLAGALSLVVTRSRRARWRRKTNEQ